MLYDKKEKKNNNAFDRDGMIQRRSEFDKWKR